MSERRCGIAGGDDTPRGLEPRRRIAGEIHVSNEALISSALGACRPGANNRNEKKRTQYRGHKRTMIVQGAMHVAIRDGCDIRCNSRERGAHACVTKKEHTRDSG